MLSSLETLLPEMPKRQPQARDRGRPLTLTLSETFNRLIDLSARNFKII